MSARIAIGVGCRLGSTADAIEALVRQAVAQASDAERLGLFSICDKRGEPGLIEAASRLGLALFWLSHDVLRDQDPFVRTRSARVQARFGVRSVAEASALAGAGAGSALIVPRIAARGVTCAIAAAHA